MEQLEQKLTEMTTELTTFTAKAQGEIASLGAVTTETKADISAIRAKMDEMQTQLDAVFDARNHDRTTAPEPEFKSIGQLVTDTEKYKEGKHLEWRGKTPITMHLDSGAFPLGTPAGKIAQRFAQKTITNTGLGFGTSGIGMPQFIGGPLPLAQVELRVRDLLNVQPFTGGMYMWVRQTTRTNAASPQVEAAAKAESTYAYDTQSGLIKTIAHWTRVSTQALDDISWLRNEIDTELMYGLLLKEETEILTGDGTGEHLNGLVTQATAFSTSLLKAVGWTRIDILRYAKLQARLAGLATFAPSGYVLHPTDMAEIELTKDTQGHYIVGDPKTGAEVKFLWGLPVVESDSLTSGTFLVGAFNTAATLLDRMKATVDISFEDSDNFEKNLATIRAEERVGLAVKRPTAFIRGTFTTSPAGS